MRLGEEIEDRLHDLARRAGFAGASPTIVAAVLVLCALAVSWAVWRWWPSGDGASAAVAGEGRTASTAAMTAVSGAPASIVATGPLVHVVGRVRHPGVYTLAPGARVNDAIIAAGGPLGDAACQAVNLARVVSDGEQIAVPSLDEVAKGVAAAGGAVGAASSGSGAVGGAAGPVNINTANEALLDTLPGVGPSTAQKIIADREANGPFASVDDLGRVTGIGPKKLEQLRELVCAN